MKNVNFALSLVFCVLLQFVQAQSTAVSNTAKTTQAKPASVNPGKASATAKPAPGQKKPRSIHVSGKVPESVKKNATGIKK